MFKYGAEMYRERDRNVFFNLLDSYQLFNKGMHLFKKKKCYKIKVIPKFYMFESGIVELFIVPTKNDKIQMTNDVSVYNLPLVNCNVYWPIIGHLYCMTLFFWHYTLFHEFRYVIILSTF